MRARGRRPRHLRALAGVGIVALALACGPSPASGDRGPAAAPATAAPVANDGPAAGPASPPAPLQKVRGSYSGIQVVQSPAWLALEGGYFREQGLDVDLTLITSGATLLAALRNGEVELAGTGGSTLLLGYVEGLETMLIGAPVRLLDFSLFVRPEIRTTDDLRGKTLGVNRLKSTTDVGTRLALQRLGLQPDVDVFTRGTGGQTESLAAMETGAVDGATFGMPILVEARRRGYTELVKINDQGIRIPFINGAIGTTKRVIDQQPDMIDRAMRALAQGITRFKRDREFGVQVLGKYSQLESRDLLEASVDYYQPLLEPDLYPDREAMQVVIDAEENPAARTMRPEDVTDYRFAERLRQSGFLDELVR
jgi:NitT/TauT family transport system substrate-binding protein